MVDRVDWENVNDCRRDATYCWAEENCWKCLLLVLSPNKAFLTIQIDVNGHLHLQVPENLWRTLKGIFNFSPWGKSDSQLNVETRVKSQEVEQPEESRPNWRCLEQITVRRRINKVQFWAIEGGVDWLQIFSNCHWWNIFDSWVDEIKITVWEAEGGGKDPSEFSLSLLHAL